MRKCENLLIIFSPKKQSNKYLSSLLISSFLINLHVWETNLVKDFHNFYWVFAFFYRKDSVIGFSLFCFRKTSIEIFNRNAVKKLQKPFYILYEVQVNSEQIFVVNAIRSYIERNYFIWSSTFRVLEFNSKALVVFSMLKTRRKLCRTERICKNNIRGSNYIECWNCLFEIIRNYLSFSKLCLLLFWNVLKILNQNKSKHWIFEYWLKIYWLLVFWVNLTRISCFLAQKFLVKELQDCKYWINKNKFLYLWIAYP